MQDRLAGLKILSLDVDGVLTDGGLYYTESGEELRKFNVKDGMGMKRVQSTGVTVVIITTSSTPAIAHRGRVLGMDHVYLQCEDKLSQLVQLCDQLKVDLDQVAHVGDDLVDLPVMRTVGCPMTVADAVDQVKEAALYIAEKKGGDGAVREICDMIFEAKNNR